MFRKKYRNPWLSYAAPSLLTLIRAVGRASPSAPPGTPLPRVLKPNLNTPCTEPRMMWLGHASVYLQLSPGKEGDAPIGILFDPIFSDR
jgi:hypothetical protein